MVLPPPSLEYLAVSLLTLRGSVDRGCSPTSQRAQSITSSIVNFLSAMALVNNGVKEILPFVRYIAQFIEYEFNSIKTQDKGQGVVCAATWLVHSPLHPQTDPQHTIHS